MSQAEKNPRTADSPCLVCGGREVRLELEAPDFEYRCRPGTWNLVQCIRCGHVFLDPIPPLSEVASLYPATYYTVNAQSPIAMSGTVVEQKMIRDAENLRHALGDRSIRSLLDVGGGNLTRLIRMKEVFGKASEVEAACLDLQFDSKAREIAASAGIRCVEGNVETDLSGLETGHYDLVILRQLIEHLRDPRAALRQLRRILTPRGVLVIDTPNRGGWDYRLFRRRYWGGYHVPRHFHLFDCESLAKVVRECGYQVERHGCTPSIAFWIISFRNALGLNSIERGRSIWEFLTLKSLPVAGGFYLLDTAWLMLGGETSNQYLWASPLPGDTAGE